LPESAIEPVARIVRAEKLLSHHAPLFGAILNVLGVDRLHTQRLFLYLGSRSVISAAVRLGVVGAYDAQQIQGTIGEEIDRTIERCGHLTPLEITQTAPLIDLRQATHDRLYSRLFQS
jgi:urease accessory protein